MEIALPQRTSGPSTAVSLYQQTLSMIEKLYSLPGFDHYLFPNGVDAYVADPTSFAPFEIIWACFRLGTPFLHLYNQLRPKKRLSVPVLGEAGAPPKKAVYEFLVACKSELHLQEKELFTISGLFKDDTNEFVKLMNTISIVVQKIEDMGLFPLPKPLPFALPSVRSTGGPQDNRAKLLTEMLNTERAYAADLEKLQRYQRELQSQDVVPRDMLLQLFANLDELLDFQRRFLLQMEATLSMPPAEQHIGQLYITNEEAFTVYVPFCGNYHSAIQIATENAATLQRVPDMDPVRELPSYLIKPVQRVCKYPLLLNELVKYSDPATYPHMEELKEGLAAIKRVTDLVNEEQRQEENRRIKQDVLDRVEDWKDLDVNEFGSLLLSDRFPMNSGDAEKDFDLFLFETILLCCKDTAKKRKSKKNIDTTSYQLKGNIYIDRIDSIMDECSAEEQRFQLKVFWKDGLETESFVLRCRNMEQVKLWKGRLDGLLSAQRMQRLSMKEATANMYSRSMQVNPEFIRRMSVAPNSYDDGYFDGYDAIPIPLSSSARGRGGDFRDPSDLPPSPPQSMPGSPRGSASTARKMSLASAMAPPRSMTSPFPLSQVYQEPQRMGSTSSATSYQPQQQPPPPPQHYNSSSSLNSLNSITPGSPTATLRIRMHHGASNQSFVIAVAPTVTFSDLQAKMERKIRLCGGNQDGRRLRMRYKDEDGDFIAIANDEDVGMCFEAARGRMGKSGGEGFVNVWIV
ncbi:uncharacterized protein EV422DRAFT_591923 [Fimicolochytrium jonesii]|uniref:uncharacterized protein n=1 Tax=Fimicolochytrium jonesii TaxID=1396493 RepID=UPI0022FEE89C|nr:uncharacterized protein EV422DRAFT_591923 [Fimicolochytrium jonesii]KAI8816152.1 hypothetical protein EV422DRAFT_591923 [Fimicolochytrium jonesii]